MKQMCRVIFIGVLAVLFNAVNCADKSIGCSPVSSFAPAIVITQLPAQIAADTKEKEAKGKVKKAEPVFEGKPMEFNAPPFNVLIPVKNWKAEETNDPANPLTLSHANTGLIQILTFQSTMTTIPELIEQLNKTFERQFSADGAREYAIEGSKDYKNASMAGKRVRAHFRIERDIFILEQIYLQGNERVFVITLMVKKPLYRNVIVDFDGVAKSLAISAPLPSPEPTLTPAPTPAPSSSSPATPQAEEKRNE
ncbi:MAG: hypothetical protein AB2L14_37485 [Candidatus Xenobiia bacterium LiM19]